jgi:dsDNA-specific endonuclease/ATPase MutS2
MSQDDREQEYREQLNELVRLLGNLSENHKSVLVRHEQLFGEAYEAAQTHAQAITDLRADVRNIAEAVQQQNNIITTMQQRIVKLQQTLAIDDSVPPAPSAPN